jgi:lipid II:glycine glycyltransferase (peptidoglycan interpeptide bridge formation enzyme)
VSDYSIETGNISEAEWNGLLAQFNDATIYQTHAYGAVRWGSDKLSHAVVRRNGEIVGAAQAVIYKVPLIPAGIAYIPWGPLWRKRGEDASTDNLAGILTGLKEEYCTKRGLLLRISPSIVEDANASHLPNLFQGMGYVKDPKVTPYRTLMLDLSREPAEIRKKLDQKWRNQLNRSEKNSLEVVEGTSADLYEIFLTLQKEMQDRKQYQPTIDYVEFGDIQRKLPELMKMHIVICKHEGQPVTATIGSAVGDTGIYLLGATGEMGMKQKSAYLSQWKMILWLQERGCRWYDLGGIDPDNNPGVYHFKVGMTGADVRHIGQYEVRSSAVSSLAVGFAEKIKELKRSGSSKNNTAK